MDGKHLRQRRLTDAGSPMKRTDAHGGVMQPRPRFTIMIARKVNGVNTEVGKHRRQNRCADVHGAGVVQEHTKEDEQDVHAQKDHVSGCHP